MNAMNVAADSLLSDDVTTVEFVDIYSAVDAVFNLLLDKASVMQVETLNVIL